MQNLTGEQPRQLLNEMYTQRKEHLFPKRLSCTYRFVLVTSTRERTNFNCKQQQQKATTNTLNFKD